MSKQEKDLAAKVQKLEIENERIKSQNKALRKLFADDKAVAFESSDRMSEAVKEIEAMKTEWIANPYYSEIEREILKSCFMEVLKILTSHMKEKERAK